ncbi:MAG: hypothetical protein CSA81_08835 [Acidobacteria bacterium]|nr:MAG: hypothetical protein CSA81_08835 [Acidobacteriota bacterium]
MVREVRIDKWLCAVRIFKTRSLAAKALNGGRIKLNGESAKPNKSVKVGDVISMKNDGRTAEYEVTGIIEKRVGAKLAVENYNLTMDAHLPEDMREMTQLVHTLDRATRRRGKPSKKERRQIEKFKDGFGGFK